MDWSLDAKAAAAAAAAADGMQISTPALQSVVLAVFSQPSSTFAWGGLPTALFHHVCSFLCLPIYDTLLSMSAVCRHWSQLLDGGDSAGFDCWRFVPPLTLQPRHFGLLIHGERKVLLPAVATALHSLRHIRSIVFSFTGRPTAGYSPYFAPFTVVAPSSAPSLTASDRPLASRSSLEQLSIDLRDVVWEQEPTDAELFSASLSHCLLRCPPLRSFELRPERGQWWPIIPTPAALRRLASGRLVHAELEAAALSAMVWADEPEPTRPWKGAVSLRSLVLHSPHLTEPNTQLMALCLALPSLTQLHLPEYHSSDAIQYIMEQLGSHLAFLRLTSSFTSQRSAVMQCTALQSLYLRMGSSAQDIGQVLDCLPLLPQLVELSIVEGRGVRGRAADGVPVVLPLLPSLTYLHLRFTKLVVALQPALVSPLDPTVALPPSLLYLSLALPAAQTEGLLSSLPADCPQLTHCHISSTDDESAQWSQQLHALRSALGTAVWCDSEDVVEQHRLDRRWQRGAGLRLLEY